jgi:hypothetical protein
VVPAGELGFRVRVACEGMPWVEPDLHGTALVATTRVFVYSGLLVD